MANKADEVYLMEAGVPLLQFDGNGRITRHTFAGNLAALDEVFAVEDFKPEGPTEVDKLIWLFADHQGTVRDLYVHTPFGETVADGDYPTDETTGVVKKKYEHLQYDPFGARANYAGDPAELYLHDIVSFGYEGNNYDKAAGGYLAGGNLYEPQSGRLMSPAGSGENPYVYGGNSPVDRSLGISRQQMADDFTSSRFDAGYSHYLDPREGWNGNAEDRLFAIGKFAAWGVAIVAGSAAGAITWGAAIAANLANVTFAGVATYAAKNVAVAGIETVGEGLLANAMGDDTFSASGSFARNVGFNLTVGLLPGAAESKAAARTAAVARTLGGRLAGKAAKYGVHYASEVAVGTTFDTAWEVGVNGRDVGDAFTQTLVGNSVGQLLGDGLSAGLQRGLKAAGIQQFGRLCFIAGTIVIRGDGSEQAIEQIEQIELGSKVQPRNANYVESNPPDPATWRKVTLRALNAADADVEIELLRPLSWLESQRAKPGSVVHVEIAELNLDGDARVLSVEPCPPIQPGPGAVVTGRFSHVSNDLVEVWVEGLEERITGTSQHPFWSVTRQSWVPACELQTGELLETKSGTAQVVSIGYRDDEQRVYNLEVHREHTYRATTFGVAVHNSSWQAPNGATVAELGLSKETARKRLNLALGSVVGDGLAGHHLLPLEAISDPRTARIVEAAARGGFGMNGSNNGVLLSQLFHRGGHPKAIERMIRKVSRLSGSDVEIATNLQAILDAERAFLLRIETSRLAAAQAGRGRIFLNK